MKTNRHQVFILTLYKQITLFYCSENKLSFNLNNGIASPVRSNVDQSYILQGTLSVVKSQLRLAYQAFVLIKS